MNNSLSTILMFLVPFLAFIILIYFLIMFTNGILAPKISLSEILKKIEPNKSIYIEHKKISKKEFELYNGIETEKNLIKITYLRNSYYKLITYSKDKSQFELFWIKKTNCIGSNFMVEILIGESLKNIIGTKYIEEKSIEKLNEIQIEYKTKKVLISNNCPACGAKTEKDYSKCKKCGLNLSM